MKFLFALLLLSYSFTLNSQIDSNRYLFKVNSCKLSVGYIYQNENIFETALKLDYKKLSSKKCFSVLPGLQYTKHLSVGYFNPFIMTRAYIPVKKYKAIVFSISYSSRKINSISSNSLCFEAGISLEPLSISYGYNYFIDNKFDWVTPHRISIRTMLH